MSTRPSRAKNIRKALLNNPRVLRAETQRRNNETRLLESKRVDPRLLDVILAHSKACHVRPSADVCTELSDALVIQMTLVLRQHLSEDEYAPVGAVLSRMLTCR